MTYKTTKPTGPFVLITFEGDDILFDERGIVMMNGKPKQTNVARLYFEKDLGEHKAKYWTLNIDEAQKFGTMDEATAQLCKLKHPHLIKIRKLPEASLNDQLTESELTRLIWGLKAEGFHPRLLAGLIELEQRRTALQGGAA
ncbi:MAG: hypothetical protein ACTIMC_05775 [Kluyvera intermedia]